jgi:adenosylhomocysteine nucleosidase
MLGIIGAMEVEVSSLKNEMENSEVKTVANMDFHKGKINGKDVVVVKSGIGKVNAAICTQILKDIYDVNAVVNTGVAGSLNNDIDICDIVISNKAQQHDMDVTPLGYEKGIIPDMKESVFCADEQLVNMATESIEELNLDIKVFKGKVLSGDQFIGNAEKKEELKSAFKGDCAEMEGAAIAQTAYLNNIPFLIIRAISDKADGGAEMDYPAFEKKAAENSIKLLNKIIEKY